jgi:hypothetical protein
MIVKIDFKLNYPLTKHIKFAFELNQRLEISGLRDDYEKKVENFFLDKNEICFSSVL